MRLDQSVSPFNIFIYDLAVYIAASYARLALVVSETRTDSVTYIPSVRIFYLRLTFCSQNVLEMKRIYIHLVANFLFKKRKEESEEENGTVIFALSFFSSFMSWNIVGTNRNLKNELVVQMQLDKSRIIFAKLNDQNRRLAGEKMEFEVNEKLPIQKLTIV